MVAIGLTSTMASSHSTSQQEQALEVTSTTSGYTTEDLTTQATYTLATTIADEVTTFASTASTTTENPDWLILGTKPEYVIIPCILLGIPALVLVYCLMKSVLKKEILTDDELWMRNKNHKKTTSGPPPHRRNRRQRKESTSTKGSIGRSSISPITT